MPAKFRLTRADFKLFSSQRVHRVRGIFFTLSITPLPVGSVQKIACIVSKKAAKKAVDRNHIKRRTRAILQSLVPHIHMPVALAFYANNMSNRATFDELSKDITDLLRQNSLLIQGETFR